MKKNDRIQLNNASVPEIEKKIQDARSRLLSLRKEVGLGKAKNVRELRSLRKDIARMLTIISTQNSK